MNTGTPIFKIHKIQHFITIWQKPLSEISYFHEQNLFITKAYDWRNTVLQKWTHYSMTVVAIGQNVKTYPTTQCKFLLILKMWVLVFIGASWV